MIIVFEAQNINGSSFLILTNLKLRYHLFLPSLGVILFLWYMLFSVFWCIFSSQCVMQLIKKRCQRCFSSPYEHILPSLLKWLQHPNDVVSFGIFTFSLVPACVVSGLVRMVNGDASLSKMPWNDGSILGETISKQSLKERLRWGSMRACLLRPSPSCRSSMRGPRTRWKGKARQKVASPMRRSLGLVESESEGRLALFIAAFWQMETDGGRTSCIWKDKQTVGMAVGRGDGGDGDEGGEDGENRYGVASPSVLSASLLDNKGVKGGTSSTSTSEWKIRRATARINPGITSPTTGAGLKQWRSKTLPLLSCLTGSSSLSNFPIPFSSSWRSLHWKEGLSDEARRPVEVRMCSKMASKPLKKSRRFPPTARSTLSFSSKQRPKNSSPKCSRSSQDGTPGCGAGSEKFHYHNIHLELPFSDHTQIQHLN